MIQLKIRKSYLKVFIKQRYRNVESSLEFMDTMSGFRVVETDVIRYLKQICNAMQNQIYPTLSTPLPPPR